MRVCLCTISYREKLLDVALRAASRIGFEAVELWGREPHVAEEYDETRVKGIRTLLDEHGLQVVALGSYHYFGKTSHKEDSVTLANTLHTAHGLRTPIVRVWASDVSSAKATPEVWAQTVAAAQEACDRAAKMNVVFAAEMHDNTLADTAKSALRLVEDVNRPNFRLNFQVSTNLSEDQFVRLETVLPYVVHVHCQNYVPGSNHEAYKRITMGEGVFDYRQLMARLNETGYTGHVAIEFAAEEGVGKEASLKKDLDFLCSL